MVITSSAVAMSSGRAYSRQANDRSSVSSWGEVLSATTSPTAMDSRSVTERESKTDTVELFQNYTEGGRLVAQSQQQEAFISVKELKQSEVKSSSEEPEGVYITVTKNISEQMFGRIFSGDGSAKGATMSLKDFFSLLIHRRQEDFERFMDNFRSGMRMASRSSSVTVTVDFGGSQMSLVELSGSKKLSVTSKTIENSSVESEDEKTKFATAGKVTTADGRQIDFDMDLSMSRSFTRSEKTSVDVVEAKLTDPLVVNFGTGSTELRDKTFRFDIDADGELDNISMLGQACGYLAYDKNDDGQINDGSELFGTKSGDGFADLAVYDADGNGWIDENDPIFDKLKIWSKDDAGNDVLVGLGVRGIGAIYLGNAPTQFSINNTENQTLGVVRSTGVFLREDGTAGSIQQVDMAKQAKAG